MERRQFLKASLNSLACISFPGLLGWSTQVVAQQHIYNVVIARVDRPSMTGGRTLIPFWQYIDVATGRPLEMNALTGDTVIINLQNNLSLPVNLIVPGLMDDAPDCPPLGVQTYTFVAPSSPGSFVFFDVRNGLTGRAMGLSGSLVVRPADGINRLYNGGPTYDREHSVLLQEVDTRHNLAVDSGVFFDLDNYEPDYFYVNGISYGADRVQLMMGLGEDVAIRFINAGLIFYPMHFHGYHVNVVTRNRFPETGVISKDTVLVKTNECVEVILPVGQQAGLYPLHSHFVPAVTNNGLYPGGGLIMLNAG